MSDAAADPIADAIEQARQGGTELTEEQINHLRKIRDEQGPGVRFVIHISDDMGLGISVLGPDHEQHQAEYAKRRANRPDWVRQMERAAVAIAFPDWVWQDGDDASIMTFGQYEKDRYQGFIIAVDVHRAATGEQVDAILEDEEAAKFLHNLINSDPQAEESS